MNLLPDAFLEPTYLKVQGLADGKLTVLSGIHPWSTQKPNDKDGFEDIKTLCSAKLWKTVFVLPSFRSQC